jgi:hypothetical protein
MRSTTLRELLVDVDGIASRAAHISRAFFGLDDTKLHNFITCLFRCSTVIVVHAALITSQKSIIA